MQVLKTLNSNCETPYLIWDNGTRAELIDFLETQRQTKETCDLAIENEFNYSAHCDKLQVGRIFVQVYNQQPTFPIEVK